MGEIEKLRELLREARKCASTNGWFELESRIDAALAPPDAGIRWVRIPAGTITTKDGRVLTVERDFELAATPTTQAQYERVMGENPSYFKGADHPVECVSAIDADRFAAKIGARLPTEVEWEYACLAGKPDDPYGPLLDIAWVRDNSETKTHAVGEKQPNAWGLYDMLGNVWEWTQTVTEPANSRVIRGGCWSNSDAAWVRAASRFRGSPSVRSSDGGFRCVRGVQL